MKYIQNIIDDLYKYSKPNEIDKFKNFHKTSKGGYAEDDIFLGITVPHIRIVAKKYFKVVSQEEIEKLLRVVI